MNSLGRGLLSHSSLRLGRQFVFDYSPGLLGSPVIDGATLGYHDSRLGISLFSGRRVNFFGSAETDPSVGWSVSYQFQPRTSGTANYFFLSGLHRYAFDVDHQISDIRTGASLTFRNGDPIDLGLRALYTSPSSSWTVRGKVIRRLTDEDFVFDIFRERERRRRPLLFRTRSATELNLDVDYQLWSWLTLGGGVEARIVDGGEAPFDNTFEQVTVRLLWTPVEPWDHLIQYRFRHVERGSVKDVKKATQFDDIKRAGETDYHEVNSEISYRLTSLLTARIGGYFSIYDSRSRLAKVEDVITAGGYLEGIIRIHRMADLELEYGIDRGNPEFNPEIDLQHRVRVGFTVRY